MTLDATTYPALDASLNAAAFVLLAAGYVCIKRRHVKAHAACMIAAFVVSVIFLAAYLNYHILHHGLEKHFAGQGVIRPVYFTLLISHILLAVTVPVLAIMTLSRALKGRFDRHRQIARWTLPIWAYVSLTGVIVYWLLFQLY